MQPVAAGAAVAVAAGAVAGQVHEGAPAVRRLAAAQPVPLAGDDEEGQRHPAVGRQMLGERGARREVVDVPVVAVMVGELRGGTGLGDQRVDQPGRGRGRRCAAKTSAKRSRTARTAREVRLGERADVADLVALDEGAQRRHVASASGLPSRLWC